MKGLMLPLVGNVFTNGKKLLQPATLEMLMFDLGKRVSKGNKLRISQKRIHCFDY